MGAFAEQVGLRVEAARILRLADTTFGPPLPTGRDLRIDKPITPSDLRLAVITGSQILADIANNTVPISVSDRKPITITDNPHGGADVNLR